MTRLPPHKNYRSGRRLSRTEPHFSGYFRIGGDPDGIPEFAFQALDSRLGDLARSQNSSQLHRRLWGAISIGVDASHCFGIRWTLRDYSEATNAGRRDKSWWIASALTPSSSSGISSLFTQYVG